MSVTRYDGLLSSRTISEKTNDPIFRKFHDRRIDRRTDRQTDRQTDRNTDRQINRQTAASKYKMPIYTERAMLF